MIHEIYEFVHASKEFSAYYVLALLCVAMVVDVFTGTVAAKVCSDIVFKSQVGINGIIRKAASLVVLIFCAFLVPLIPYNTGIVALYVLYLAYLGFELTSIGENLKKMGVMVAPLERFFKDSGKGDE